MNYRKVHELQKKKTSLSTIICIERAGLLSPHTIVVLFITSPAEKALYRHTMPESSWRLQRKQLLGVAHTDDAWTHTIPHAGGKAGVAC